MNKETQENAAQTNDFEDFKIEDLEFDSEDFVVYSASGKAGM